jgi:hypothetical protein
MQNQTTGQVDYLRFNGSTLQSSSLKDYGIAGWSIVANGNFNADTNPDLVIQNNTTGQLDFLYLNASGNLIGSALSAFVPHIVGAGFFGSVAGESGPALVSQLANGQLDILAFNAAGQLIASDLIPNTVGLPTHVFGAAESVTNFPIFSGVGPSNDTVAVQLADGTLDFLGFSGSLNGGTLSLSASFTRGPISDNMFALDQDNDFAKQHDANVISTVDGVTRETVDAVGVNPTTGQVDIHSWASGYGDSSHEGVSLGTIHTNFFLPTGWQVVDAGIVDHVSILPLA